MMLLMILAFAGMGFVIALMAYLFLFGKMAEMENEE